MHILLVDNERAHPKTNGPTMERAARNKEGGSDGEWDGGGAVME